MTSTHEKPVVYFCAEFGIDSRLPTYAGGLGILAGDTLKTASDVDFPMIGIGLLFKGKYFNQHIDGDGWTTESERVYSPEQLGFEEVKDKDKPLYILTNLAGADVWVNAYEKKLSNKVSLYMLSTDNNYNSQEWREIMIQDYCCDDEMQLKQQIILGVCGIKLIEALKIKPKLYHLNEGRPIFMSWQLAHHIMCHEGVNFENALAKIRQMTVYTNHTLIKAGNLTYPPEVVRKYATGFVTAMGITTDLLLSPGIDPESKLFSITHYALNISRKASSVSQIHGKFAREDWPNHNWVSITNGVHFPTWQESRFGKSDLSLKDIWNIHLEKKRELQNEVQKRTGYGYDENRLVISWARRIASYKKLDSIFADVARLKNIVSKSDMPIQILIGGKAHYGDDRAKNLIQSVVKYMQNELSGYALYVPDYDMELAQKMVSGSDVWLNTPEFGKEACGTSGMKALSNGVINVTIKDGWTHELDWSDIGFVLDPDNLTDSIYNTIENNLSPVFYSRSENGIPIAWVKMMKKSIKASYKFNSKRMFEEYIKELYTTKTDEKR